MWRRRGRPEDTDYITRARDAVRLGIIPARMEHEYAAALSGNYASVLALTWWLMPNYIHLWPLKWPWDHHPAEMIAALKDDRPLRVIAQEMGIAASTISRWRRCPKVAKTLATYLRVPADTLGSAKIRREKKLAARRRR